MTVFTANTGSAGVLRLTLSESSTNAGANTSQVAVLAEIYTPSGSFHSDANLSVVLSGDVSWSTSTWSFSSGGGWHTLYSGTVTKSHNADGTGSFSATFRLNSSTGTTGVGGPAQVSGSITLSTLTVAPGTPTGLTASRVSDTQASLAWTNHQASNGVATQTVVHHSINGGAYVDILSSGNIASAVVATAANRKTIYQVRQANGAGTSAWSAASPAVFTSPAAPTNVVAAKNSAGNIVLTWTNNVGYSEYESCILHGTVTGGVITWDGTAFIATAAAGVTTWTHTSPDPTKVHVYSVQTRALTSPYIYSTSATQSNQVQLIVAPNAPTLADIANFSNRAAALVVTWTHNPVDTTAQTAYELQRSTDGGATWPTTTGKTTSTTSSYTLAANTYSANATVAFRVRTWGAATTGGADGTGASPWSSIDSTTFKSLPVASITTPANASTYTQATLTVALGFSQAEGATFVQGTIVLLQGSTVLETRQTTTLGSTTMSTRLSDGVSYTLQVQVTDSNGLTSAVVSSTFAVDYTEPVPASVVATYVPTGGAVQLDLTIPTPGAGEAAATAVTVTRTIDGSTETIVERFAVPSPASISFLDTTPTINGVNHYEVWTYSADGAATSVTVDVTTSEGQWAFLSTGEGFSQFVAFYGNLVLASTPERDTALVQAAGRSRPIALFGEVSTYAVDASATIVSDEGSTVRQIEEFLLTAGRTCFRAPDGTRVFGAVKGKISGRTWALAQFDFTVSEAS